jgi:hypothetical protein
MPKQNFKLDKNFYAEELVLLAREAFSDFDITITPVGIEISEENPQSIFDEFSNYCLGLSNEQIA